MGENLDWGVLWLVIGIAYAAVFLGVLVLCRMARADAVPPRGEPGDSVQPPGDS